MTGSYRRGLIVQGVAACVLAAVAAPQSRAGLAFNFTGGYNAIVGSQTSTAGNDAIFFTTLEPITVSTLSYYHDGAVHTNAVGLYRVSDGVLLASANVTTTADLLPLGSYDSASITPITLDANVQYAVVGAMAPGQIGQYVTQATVQNIGAGQSIAFSGYKYNYDTSLSLPGYSYGEAYVGPNFGYAAVPAPAALIPFASLLISRRRRS